MSSKSKKTPSRSTPKKICREVFHKCSVCQLCLSERDEKLHKDICSSDSPFSPKSLAELRHSFISDDLLIVTMGTPAGEFQLAIVFYMLICLPFSCLRDTDMVFYCLDASS